MCKRSCYCYITESQRIRKDLNDSFDALISAIKERDETAKRNGDFDNVFELVQRVNYGFLSKKTFDEEVRKLYA